MGTVLAWEEPPVTVRRRGHRLPVDHERIAAALRGRPGRWARLPMATTGLAGQIKRGDLRAYRPAGAFEAVRRGDGDEIRVWVRFVGQEPPR